MMKSIPRTAIALDTSPPMFTIFHEHELGCCRMPAIYSFSRAPSTVLHWLLLSPCTMSCMHPFHSTVGLVSHNWGPPWMPAAASRLTPRIPLHYSCVHLITCWNSGDLFPVFIFSHLLFLLLVTVSSRKEWKEGKKINRTHLKLFPPSSTEFSCFTSRDLGWIN